MKAKKSRYYQVGLGDRFLRRAKIIFAIVLLTTLGLSGSAIYAGVTSGQLNKVVIDPLKSLAKETVATWEEATRIYPTPSLTPINIINSTSSKSSVEINTNVKTNTSTSTQKSNTSPTYSPQTYTAPTSKPLPTFPPMKSWEQIRQEQDAWSKQKQAENDAWFKQQTEAARQDQSSWWAQKQKELEEWKKQNGF